MTWVKVDDRMPEHPKVAGLSDRAFRAHVEALCYCAGSLTDGAISTAVAKSRRWQRSADELVAARLWETAETGWRIHDYLTYQRSKESARTLSETRAEMGSRGGKASANAKQIAGALLKQSPSRSEEIRSEGEEEPKRDRSPQPPTHPDARTVYAELASSLGVMNPPIGWAESWLQTRTLAQIRDAIGKAREKGVNRTAYVDAILEKPPTSRVAPAARGYNAPPTERDRGEVLSFEESAALMDSESKRRRKT